jgi:hypothetical protein
MFITIQYTILSMSRIQEHIFYKDAKKPYRTVPKHNNNNNYNIQNRLTKWKK